MMQSPVNTPAGPTRQAARFAFSGVTSENFGLCATVNLGPDVTGLHEEIGKGIGCRVFRFSVNHSGLETSKILRRVTGRAESLRRPKAAEAMRSRPHRPGEESK